MHSAGKRSERQSFNLPYRRLAALLSLPGGRKGGVKNERHLPKL